MTFEVRRNAVIRMAVPFLVGISVGCAPRQGYHGPQRPESELALIYSPHPAFSSTLMVIVHVDGVPSGGNPYKAVQVLPGTRHVRIEIRRSRGFLSASFYLDAVCEFKLDAAAGASYHLDGDGKPSTPESQTKYDSLLRVKEISMEGKIATRPVSATCQYI